MSYFIGIFQYMKIYIKAVCSIRSSDLKIKILILVISVFIKWKIKENWLNTAKNTNHDLCY